MSNISSDNQFKTFDEALVKFNSQDAKKAGARIYVNEKTGMYEVRKLKPLEKLWAGTGLGQASNKKVLAAAVKEHGTKESQILKLAFESLGISEKLKQPSRDNIDFAGMKKALQELDLHKNPVAIVKAIAPELIEAYKEAVKANRSDITKLFSGIALMQMQVYADKNNDKASFDFIQKQLDTKEPGLLARLLNNYGKNNKI